MTVKEYNDKIYVANSIGSSNYPEHPSNIEFWVDVTGKSKPKECRVRGCRGRKVIGAHVHYKGQPKNWIVPICMQCNSRNDYMRLNAHTMMVEPARYTHQPI